MSTIRLSDYPNGSGWTEFYKNDANVNFVPLNSKLSRVLGYVEQVEINENCQILDRFQEATGAGRMPAPSAVKRPRNHVVKKRGLNDSSEQNHIAREDRGRVAYVCKAGSRRKGYYVCEWNDPALKYISIQELDWRGVAVAEATYIHDFFSYEDVKSGVIYKAFRDLDGCTCLLTPDGIKKLYSNDLYRMGRCGELVTRVLHSKYSAFGVRPYDIIPYDPGFTFIGVPFNS